ncbi:malic enzyme [Citrobacter koseri]|uniref:Malic enzyme n=1 Tax=Citrobacter koseri TaxID=545 RepID=A0A2X2VXP7_CITKO|nr:malic enzyme [Citrobacter koseri]
MNALLLPSGNTFIADTYVNDDPTPEQLAEITLMAAETVRRFGIGAEGGAVVALQFWFV